MTIVQWRVMYMDSKSLRRHIIMLREELYYARVHFMDSLPPSNQVIMCIVRAFRFTKNLIGDQMLRNYFHGFVNSFWGANQILVSSKGKHRNFDFPQMLFEEKSTSPVSQPTVTE